LTQLLPLAIGLGLAVSLLFAETFGLAAGGMVVPGYLALSLSRPLDVALTVGAGLVTFVIVHALSSLLILYGRRRAVLTLLVGYLLAAVMHSAAADHLTRGGVELKVIGYVIPGLIALWLDRQGIVETLSTLITASVVVRLLLVALGVELGK
jgi:poly-gamma-glutamate biosynthesis protein PgsC/CapC